MERGGRFPSKTWPFCCFGLASAGDCRPHFGGDYWPHFSSFALLHEERTKYFNPSEYVQELSKVPSRPGPSLACLPPPTLWQSSRFWPLPFLQVKITRPSVVLYLPRSTISFCLLWNSQKQHAHVRTSKLEPDFVNRFAHLKVSVSAL
jgi:hypothetical protein